LNKSKSARFPRINKETLLPVATNDPYNPKDAWYPPGHGDFYTSLFDSGLLEQFKKAGKELVSPPLIVIFDYEIILDFLVQH